MRTVRALLLATLAAAAAAADPAALDPCSLLARLRASSDTTEWADVLTVG
jgi:hypothetical protein